MILLGFLLIIVVGIVNVVLGILIWIAELVGLLGGNPIPNGILPDPYFTYALELVVLAVIAGGAWFLLFFLKPTDSGTHLDDQISVPSVTLLVPAAVFTYLYGVQASVPGLSPLVTPYAPEVSPAILFTGTIVSALVVTNRARRLITETGPSTTRLKGVLAYAVDTGTWLAIVAVALSGFWPAFRELITGLPGGSEEPMSVLMELTPPPDIVFLVVTGIAIVAGCMSLAYRGICTVSRYV